MHDCPINYNSPQLFSSTACVLSSIYIYLDINFRAAWGCHGGGDSTREGKLGDFYIFTFMSDTENQGKKPIYVVVLVKRTGKFIEVYSIHYTVYFGLYYMYRV